MKILLLQIARIGDVLQTWPVAAAVRRTYPKAEIHILVRKKFSEAAQLCPSITKTWILDSEKVLSPLVSNQDHTTSLNEIKNLTSQLSLEKFDEVYNLTFSSFSSYLTRNILAGRKFGYSRNSDGTPAFLGETSKYFYSQVGIGEQNTRCLTNIFGDLVGLDIFNQDWVLDEETSSIDRSANPILVSKNAILDSNPVPKHLARVRNGVVIHLGASQPQKVYPISQWVEVCRNLVKSEISIRIVGVGSEKQMATDLCAQVNSPLVENLTGTTSLQQLFGIIRSAQVFVGGDSGPLHVASLCQTPSVNLSCKFVNFWETGPRSAGSCVLYADRMNEISASRVASAIVETYNGEFQSSADYTLNSPNGQYAVNTSPHAAIPGAAAKCATVDKQISFANFLDFIYQDAPAPQLKNTFVIIHAKDLTHRLIENLALIRKNPRHRQALMVIEMIEQSILKLESTELRPLIRWFETEKMAIPPSDFQALVLRTRLIYGRFLEFLDALKKKTKQMELHDGHKQLDT